MKRLIALILVCALLTGCTPQTNSDGIQEETTAPATSQPESSYSFTEEEPPEFSDLNDVNLLPYLEDSIYSELVTALNSEDYFVENVNAIYISKEYLEEVAYNSQENIYFGYTLSELDSYFQGTRYVFTLGDDGQTVVTEFQKYDDTYDQILKNVAIGTGVILVCVTVSIVTYGAGAPAVSMIFAASAKTGTIMALSSGVFSGVSAGVVKGIEIEREKCWDGDLNAGDRVIIVHDVLVTSDQIIHTLSKLPKTCGVKGLFCFAVRKEWAGLENLTGHSIRVERILDLNDNDIETIINS